MANNECSEVEQIERSLIRLLKSISFEDLRWAEAEGGTRFRIIGCAELAKVTHESEQFEDLLRNPVATACRWAVRRLGERLFVVLGSSRPMYECFDRICQRFPNNPGYIADVLGKNWDGIGTNGDRWYS